MKAQSGSPVSKPIQNNLPWGHLWVALVISLAGTALLGGMLFLLQQNVWLIALGGMFSLLGAGAYLGWRNREPEPLYGALLAVLYFGLAAGILFGGELFEALPDPLPGLAIGDSTFFFVSPLLMLVTSVVGSVLGGKAYAWRQGRRSGRIPDYT